MATYSGKILAEGQLPNAKGTLYTCPALTVTYIKFMAVTNEVGAGTELVVIYVKKSGSTSRVVCNGTLEEKEMIRVLDDGETLELSAGDLIEGETTTATTVDYVITGVEET